MSKQEKPIHDIDKFVEGLQSVLLSRCWNLKDPELRQEIRNVIGCMIELETRTYQKHPGVDDLITVILELDIIPWLREAIKDEQK